MIDNCPSKKYDDNHKNPNNNEEGNLLGRKVVNLSKLELDILLFLILVGICDCTLLLMNTILTSKKLMLLPENRVFLPEY